VYQCRKVVSEFKQGKFEQNIEGSLFLYLKPNATNKAVTAPTPNSIDASEDTSRLSQESIGINGTNINRVPRVPTAPNLGVQRVAQTLGLQANPNTFSAATQFGRANLPMLATPPFNGNPRFDEGSPTNVSELATPGIIAYADSPLPVTSGTGGATEVVGVPNSSTVNRLTNSNLLNTQSITATQLRQLINKEF
jgi:hypothetical protein